MIRIPSLITALLLSGCMSAPAHVDVRRCCYPGAQIALARMPSSGDVAISLGAIEHVLVSRTDPSEREAVTPRLSSNQTEDVWRTSFTSTSPEATQHFNNARRPAASVAQLPSGASWIEFANATLSSHATNQDSCPTDVVDTGAQ